MTDILGATRPGGKRLRTVLKEVPALPPSCVDALEPDREAFEAWQEAVVTWGRRERSETPAGVVSRRSLNPAYRPDIEHLAFSPDGATILAQDDAGILVLDREGLVVRQQIDAADALPAVFSSDSKTISFHTLALRVETWDLKEGERVFANELVVLPGCRQSELSPDGRTLACLSGEGDLLTPG